MPHFFVGEFVKLKELVGIRFQKKTVILNEKRIWLNLMSLKLTLTFILEGVHSKKISIKNLVTYNLFRAEIGIKG